MKSIEIYFSLGSNLGERKENILEAVKMLDREIGLPHFVLSSLLETEPWGGAEGGLFINCVAGYKVPLAGQSPVLYCTSLLGKCKSIEAFLGRDDEPEYDKEELRIYKARTIDIDILFYGEEKFTTPRLLIPHRFIGQRDFVLEPLKQIATQNLKTAFPEFFEKVLVRA